MSTLTLQLPQQAHLLSSSSSRHSTHFSSPRSPILPLYSLLDIIAAIPPAPPTPSDELKMPPEMTQIGKTNHNHNYTHANASFFNTPAHSSYPEQETDLPPPPYTSQSSSKSTNPGFCPQAFEERHANSVPGGGRTGAQYFTPCACGFSVSDAIPASYKEGWAGWVDPSVNFRWESHLPGAGAPSHSGKKLDLEEGGGERLGCWICWEYDGVWKGGMGVEEWYAHFRGHVRGEGYRVCRGKTGGMQRRRNCKVEGCSKVHS